MEWIRFLLTNEKGIEFEQHTLPMVSAKNANQLSFGGFSWQAYRKLKGQDLSEFLFCTDSAVLMESIKKISPGFEKVYREPELEHYLSIGSGPDE